MNDLRHEISLLTEMLEAEIEGRPFDRRVTLALAQQLGGEFQGIRHSMQLILDRVAMELPAVA